MKHLSRIAGMLLLAAIIMTGRPGSLKADPLLNPTFDTIFSPLLADPMEPRIAVLPLLNKKQLQLDIGASADLWQNDKKDQAVGIDFATFSLLERESGFKFPVDTIDYMFGLNTSFTSQIKDSSLPFDMFSGRLRLAHISAHMEDGLYNDGAWTKPAGYPFESIPFTYSREYIDGVLALSSSGYRVYAGYQFLIHTIPSGINRNSFQAGAEVALPSHSYLAADFKLLPIWREAENKTEGFKGTWNLQVGMRLTDIGLNSVRIAYNYFTGLSRQGMLFYQEEEYSTLGLIVDL